MADTQHGIRAMESSSIDERQVHDLQNPLFIHPSDGLASLAIGEKLVGAKNYRTWRRSVEIGLSTKRKLAFVQETLPRPTDNAAKTEQWDACNNLVIAWLMNAVSDTIARSILYVQSAQEVWIQLEKRFCLSNGSRKYSSNKEVYAMKQDRISMSEYYTKMKYEVKSYHESSALFSKGPEERCGQCGNKGHDKEKCWQLIGYPSWHPRSKKFPQKKVNKEGSKNQKFNKFKVGNEKRTAAQVESADSRSGGSVTLTQQQIEQLLKLLPQQSKQGEDSEEDYEDFAGNAFCSCISSRTDAWILDTGATDHMSPVYKMFTNPKISKQKPHINMPDGKPVSTDSSSLSPVHSSSTVNEQIPSPAPTLPSLILHYLVSEGPLAPLSNQGGCKII
ncbi:hypothetical protein Cgig2_023796 [Carnegiea gigantea]|uniref:Retrotransposon Copia-like N-terminal domain-containing protein n=1 Tax=Carnegiea gigantea TaxID=171969 RepID=A0A9Q1Q8Y8_9CARY|nr:hypothetical protein Cgig2_023796 [Carnegiea gigantea]